MSICATKKVKATARRGAHWSSTAGELDADADAKWGLQVVGPGFGETGAVHPSRPNAFKYILICS